MSVSSNCRRPRTRRWLGRGKGARGEDREEPSEWEREQYYGTWETREFPNAVCVFNALSPLSSTFSVWLRRI